MREIRFKAKCEKINTWVHGNYYRHPQENQIGKNGSNKFFHFIIDDNGVITKINPFTLCQFIELQDNFTGKNHDLYDNDMVVVRYEGEWSIHRITYQAENDYPAFELYPHLEVETNGISCAISEPGYTIKWIGNYFDDPEKWDKLMRRKK